MSVLFPNVKTSPDICDKSVHFYRNKGVFQSRENCVNDLKAQMIQYTTLKSACTNNAKMYEYYFNTVCLTRYIFYSGLAC